MIKAILTVAMWVALASSSLSKEEYTIGFSFVSVTDFKKSWASDGNEPLRFPPRCANAVIVASVKKYSPAHTAGLRKQDIIRVIDGNLLKESSDVLSMIRNVDTKKGFKLSVIRRNKRGIKRKWETKTIVINPVKKSEYLSNCMHINRDEVREISILRHKDSPKYVNSSNELHLYYSMIKDVKGQLILRITYLESDWLFIRKYTIKTDENSYTITPGNIERGNGILGGRSRVWEWCNYPIASTDYKMIKDIALSNKVIVRYEGRQYFKDYEMTQDVRDRLLIVLDSFKITDAAK